MIEGRGVPGGWPGGRRGAPGAEPRGAVRAGGRAGRGRGACRRAAGVLGGGGEGGKAGRAGGRAGGTKPTSELGSHWDIRIHSTTRSSKNSGPYRPITQHVTRYDICPISHGSRVRNILASDLRLTKK